MQTKSHVHRYLPNACLFACCEIHTGLPCKALRAWFLLRGCHQDVENNALNPTQGCQLLGSKKIFLQAHYEELKVARDSAEHLSDETGRQLSRVEKQLKESQEALSQSSHEVCWLYSLSHHPVLLV